MYSLPGAFAASSQDFSAPAGEVTHDLSHAVLGDADLHQVNGFKQARAGSAKRFLKGEVPGDLEGNVLGIDRVHLAVVEIYLHIHHAVSG